MIYFLQDGEGRIKIGYTGKEDVEDRRRAAQTYNATPVKVLGTVLGTEADEKDLHRRFAAYRTNGEWFQPASELLALIPPSGLPSCGKVEVVEQSVSVRVLTVGRKQFSQKLLDQLPHAKAINWQRIIAHTEHCISPDENPAEWLTGFNLNLALFVSGDVWGWAKGGMELSGAGVPIWHRWIIFVCDGRLFKYKDVLGHFGASEIVEYHPDSKLFKRRQEICKVMYPRRLLLSGWRDEDQLFYGV